MINFLVFHKTVIVHDVQQTTTECRRFTKQTNNQNQNFFSLGLVFPILLDCKSLHYVLTRWKILRFWQGWELGTSLRSYYLNMTNSRSSFLQPRVNDAGAKFKNCSSISFLVSYVINAVYNSPMLYLFKSIQKAYFFQSYLE